MSLIVAGFEAAIGAFGEHPQATPTVNVPSEPLTWDLWAAYSSWTHGAGGTGTDYRRIDLDANSDE